MASCRRAASHIHEAAGQVLPRPTVVDDLLHQRLAQPLRHAAVDLALQSDRVHHRADIVDHDVADDLQRAGIGVDFDLADVAAIGKPRRLRRRPMRLELRDGQHLVK